MGFAKYQRNIETFIKKNWKMLLVLAVVLYFSAGAEREMGIGRGIQAGRDAGPAALIGVPVGLLIALILAAVSGVDFGKLIGYLIIGIGLIVVGLPLLGAGLLGSSFARVVIMGLGLLLMFKMFTSSRSSY